ncbi:response regulator (plasmid) [Kovacikia minuta CCNUW1]|uniref:response regulator n=1 Tax=Kovacikia minuta TaxID=2931930 RepID=UPI001CCDDBF3|nr:response regulator [Kovacikia minuta]UBF30010.1 response regulator [Kovacikia minuta CCNUW1]
MKILLIEDDLLTTELLSTALSSHHYAVDAIADGEAGLEMAIQWSYDLILLDILIPKLNGIEVCHRLRAQGCQTPILMLTVKDSNEDIIAGLDAGADDYVAKSCDSSQLLARVRALLRRGSTVSASPLLTWEHLCLDPALARVTYKQQVVALRPKEYNLLELFLRYPQRILSRSTIIDHLWSIDETPVEGAVTNLIKDLRHRLKSAGMVTDLIETVYGLGYRLKPVPEGSSSAERGDGTIATAVKGLVAQSALVADAEGNWNVRTQQGIRAIEQIAERFQVSLEERLNLLEAVVRSLQTDSLSSQQRAAACREAHKLAGGLGTFGYIEASTLAQAIERLLEDRLKQEIRSTSLSEADQLSQLLNELKQKLAQPLTPLQH